MFKLNIHNVNSIYQRHTRDKVTRFLLILNELMIYSNKSKACDVKGPSEFAVFCPRHLLSY